MAFGSTAQPLIIATRLFVSRWIMGERFALGGQMSTLPVTAFGS